MGMSCAQCDYDLCTTCIKQMIADYESTTADNVQMATENWQIKHKDGKQLNNQGDVNLRTEDASEMSASEVAENGKAPKKAMPSQVGKSIKRQRDKGRRR